MVDQGEMTPKPPEKDRYLLALVLYAPDGVRSMYIRGANAAEKASWLNCLLPRKNSSDEMQTWEHVHSVAAFDFDATQVFFPTPPCVR